MTAPCQQQKGFEALEMNLIQMDQVTLAHDAAVIHGPAWAAVTSDLGRQEMVTWLQGGSRGVMCDFASEVKQVVEDFLSLHTGQVLLKILGKVHHQATVVTSHIPENCTALLFQVDARSKDYQVDA